VNAFLDTSVLVAAFYGDHQHHAASIALFAGQKKSTGATAAHCLAEVYAVVTGMPGKNRASPHEALLFLGDVRERLTLVSLDEDEYVRMIEQAAIGGIAGGATYDALIARCALKAKAKLLYTWNTKHFERLGADVARRVREPG
jgi:predicted nucleic acid-binding protein